MKRIIVTIILMYSISTFAGIQPPAAHSKEDLSPKGTCPVKDVMPPMDKKNHISHMQSWNHLDSENLSCLKKNYSTLIGIRYSYPEVYDVLMDMIKTANIAPCEVETFMGSIMASEEGKNTNMPAPDSMDKQGVMPEQE